MKIVKGADPSRVEWTVRKIIEMLEDGKLDYNIDIQRGYVWKNIEKRSALIRSLILERAIPPLYFNKINDVYQGEDGKQRVLTIQKYLKDGFALSGLPPFEVMNDDGEPEEIDLNGYKFTDLPEEFKNAIKEYSFIIVYTNDADQEEVADTFYNLNNGQTINAACINRIKAKSRKQLAELTKHEVFKEALSETALDGHVQDDLVGRAHAVINAENPEMNTSWIRPYLRNTSISDSDVENMNKVFDRIRNIHCLIEDKRIAKRIYGRTHMISIVPVIWKSIQSNKTDEQMMEWFVSFFCGKKSATISSVYNGAAGGSGTGKKDAVRKRLNEVEKNYIEFFNTK